MIFSFGRVFVPASGEAGTQEGDSARYRDAALT